MMRDEIVEILLHAGIPAGVKGFTYIHDALDLLDTDPYYITGRVSALYESVAKMNQATAAQVERAMRHAFETALTRGQAEQIERYLDSSTGQNSNQIKTLYLRWKQEQHRGISAQPVCDLSADHCRAQVYEDALREIGVVLDQMRERISLE